MIGQLAFSINSCVWFTPDFRYATTPLASPAFRQGFIIADQGNRVLVHCRAVSALHQWLHSVRVKAQAAYGLRDKCSRVTFHLSLDSTVRSK